MRGFAHEGHKLGIASNHADVGHWFIRHCKSMDGFRADVLDALEPVGVYRVQVGAFNKKANAEQLLKKIKAAGFKDVFIKFE